MALVNAAPRSYGEDVARALDPAVRGSELVALAAHRDMTVRAAVASRPDAPMASLISLAHERDARVLRALAENPSSPTWVIMKLATDHRADIRDQAVARLASLDAAPSRTP
jgi:hypothetical protein